MQRNKKIGYEIFGSKTAGRNHFGETYVIMRIILK
jgi:hypothetical protein